MTYLQSLRKEEEIGQFEIEFSRFLVRNYPDASKDVLSCVVLTIHDQLNGNICTDLSSLNESVLAKKIGLTQKSLADLKSELLSSDFVGSEGDYKPFILDNDSLYLHKYWSFENELVNWLKEKADQPNHKLESDSIVKINELFETSGDTRDLQKVATCLALIKSFLIISGGPGTGKTYTAKKIIQALHIQNPDLKIALAAPTGKAAERLNDSISDLEDEYQATTLHRLLGARINGEFKYNEKEKLIHDVLIVDEASMLDIRMWVSLIRALKSSARLIVLGDKDQLSSVEAGSILGDVCFESKNAFSKETVESLSEFGLDVPQLDSINNLNDNIVLLAKTYRSKTTSGIPQLAAAINEQDLESLSKTLNSYDQVQLIEPSQKMLSELIESYSKEIVEQELNTQFLCSNKSGTFGTQNLNKLIENKVKSSLQIPLKQEWYEGRRILITRNEPTLGISNGEIGTCIRGDDNSLSIVFGKSRQIQISELKNYDLAYAITVHKSQGSEFNRVVLFFPDQLNPVLTKELLYTGVTRARESTLVIVRGELLEQIIGNPISRVSSIPVKLTN